MDLPFGYNHSNKEKEIQIISFKAKLRSHNLLENFVRISAIFFGGIILYFIKFIRIFSDTKDKIVLRFADDFISFNIKIINCGY